MWKWGLLFSLLCFAAWSWLSSTTDRLHNTNCQIMNWPLHIVNRFHASQSEDQPSSRQHILTNDPQKRLVCSPQTPDECALLPSRVCTSLWFLWVLQCFSGLKHQDNRTESLSVCLTSSCTQNTKQAPFPPLDKKHLIKVIVAFYLTTQNFFSCNSEKEVWMVRCKLWILRYIRILFQNCEILNLTNWNCKKSQISQNCEKLSLNIYIF